VVSDGFGIGYIIKSDALCYTVSSKHRQNRRYVRSLETCLKDMADLLKPISSISVDSPERRQKLVDMKKELSRKPSAYLLNDGAYGDVWGENTPFSGAVPPRSNRKLLRKESSSSRNFAKITERTNSLDLLGTLNIFSVDVAMDLDSSDTEDEESPGCWYGGHK